MGTDEDELISIFCTRSYPQLRAAFDAYSRTYSDIEEAHNDENYLRLNWQIILKYFINHLRLSRVKQAAILKLP